MLKREEWLPLARKLDWPLSYVKPEEVFPPELAGTPWLSHDEWKQWDEPYKTSYPEYVRMQAEKEASVGAVRESIGKLEHFQELSKQWLNGVKLHVATLALAEFAAVVGNLRAARFGRDSAWRTMATFGALDELRHTQIPLLLMHDLVKWDEQFDWTHKFYHSNDWVAIAGRHMIEELLLCANPIEFAIATNFVFETGFTNVQFIGLSAVAKNVGDHMFEKMLMSIQTDEARHAQIGGPVLAVVVRHNKEYAQFLVDKWFWRSWLLFAIVTGFTMDYLTPVQDRKSSFKEFMEEWILDQFIPSLNEYGLKKPWYWDTFLQNLDHYHHMVYASAYSYRSTVWFNFVVPGPEERRWLKQKYPDSWDAYEPVWEQIADTWRVTDPGVDFGVHGTSIVGFCDLCQIVLCNGTPQHNSAHTHCIDGKKFIFCSEPCRKIFENEKSRYQDHKNLVMRVIVGEAPGNLVAMLRSYFGLQFDTWGKDAFQGQYDWLNKTKGPGPEVSP